MVRFETTGPFWTTLLLNHSGHGEVLCAFNRLNNKTILEDVRNAVPEKILSKEGTEGKAGKKPLAILRFKIFSVFSVVRF
jgi:hypothetical protein